jgi:E3 SUMO-protein ligase PIAS1
VLRKANDPDIIVDSTVMSLKDPISTLRISTPCRSSVCTHNQCFDAASFLQLQEQAPTWTCPVCNKTVSFEGLAVDQYVQEILDTVPKSTEQVTIEPDGRWSKGNKKENEPSRSSTSNQQDGGSDDDLVEISDYRLMNIKNEASLNTPLSLAQTPSMSSRETSTAPRTGSKRQSEVIDLTLSDDDEPPRPKKVAYSTPNSLPEPRPHYRLPRIESPAQPRSLPSYPPAQQPNSTSSGLRLDLRYGEYRQPSARPSYPGPGAAYGSYSGSP